MELFLRLYTAHGIGFLWNGYWADALAYYPHRITEYFVKQVLEDAFAPSSWCDKIADQVGIFVAYPFKLASTRMVFDMTLNDTLKYSSITDYFAVTLKDGGVSLLFTGYLLDKGVDSLTSALREKADKTIEQLQQNHSFANLWVITAVVYSCIEFVAFPAKLVRYNMQLQAALPKELYAGAIDCCIKIYRAGGFKAFYSGITLSLAAVSLFALLITAVNRSNYSKAKME
ncbi:hypothetical protein IWW36_004451 [Coemansia brasiliensis]|uniref:ADP,ATP carrier protein n=1 Tax=Coemansia brasiliensis TaxID=2650707 RepID=A0A9W8LW88_9FUNG|nr:hypothetical protein IWW36_004451 [Coemansia brasiliensis]